MRNFRHQVSMRLKMQSGFRNFNVLLITCDVLMHSKNFLEIDQENVANVGI